MVPSCWRLLACVAALACGCARVLTLESKMTTRAGDDGAVCRVDFFRLGLPPGAVYSEVEAVDVTGLDLPAERVQRALARRACESGANGVVVVEEHYRPFPLGTWVRAVLVTLQE